MSVYRGGPKIILERPRFAEILGAIAATWGDIDNQLAQIFNLTTFAKILYPGATTGSDIAFTIFDNFTNIHTRTKVIKNILAKRYSKEAVQKFNTLKKGIETEAKKRNKLVHTDWKINDEEKEALFDTSSKGNIKYSINQFSDTLESSVALRNDLNDFIIWLSHEERKEF